MQATLLLLATLAVSAILLSFYPAPIPSALSSGLSSDDPSGYVPATDTFPVASSGGTAEITVRNNVYGGTSTIPDNTSDQSIWNFADMFEPGIVTAILASVDLSHPSQGDLKIVLTAPDGTEAILHNRKGGHTPYVVKEYTSATNSALASLAGQLSDARWTLSVGDYSQGRVGTMESIRVDLTYVLLPPVPNPIRTASGIDASPDIPIPDDADGQDTSLALNIHDGGTVSDVFVLANITHPYRGDLRVVLTAPDGTETVLHDRSGGGQNNVVAVYSSDTGGDLGRLMGYNTAGDWTISVGDYRDGDTGTLNQWGMTLEYDKPF